MSNNENLDYFEWCHNQLTDLSKRLQIIGISAEQIKVARCDDKFRSAMERFFTKADQIMTKMVGDSDPRSYEKFTEAKMEFLSAADEWKRNQPQAVAS